MYNSAVRRTAPQQDASEQRTRARRAPPRRASAALRGARAAVRARGGGQGVTPRGGATAGADASTGAAVHTAKAGAAGGEGGAMAPQRSTLACVHVLQCTVRERSVANCGRDASTPTSRKLCVLHKEHATCHKSSQRGRQRRACHSHSASLASIRPSRPVRRERM